MTAGPHEAAEWAEAERDDLVGELAKARKALAEIADGGCTGIFADACDPDDRCDPCTAQAALDATGGTP